MYIPFCESELLRITYKEVEEDKITLLIKPCCGNNEFLLYQIQQSEDIDNIQKISKIFDYFCVGYVDQNGKDVTLQNSSKYFKIEIMAYICNNLYNFSRLNNDQKKT